MNALMEFAVSNAIAAAAVAVAVFAFTRFARRPALTAGLWLLVLAKLVTPAVWTIEVGMWAGPGDTIASPGNSTHLLAERAQGVAGPPHDSTVTPSADSPSPALAAPMASGRPRTVDRRPARHKPPRDPAAPSPFVDTRPLASTGHAFAHPLLRADALMVVWLTGTLGLLTITFTRAVRFNRMTRQLRPGPPWLQEVASGLSQSFGLRRAPRVLVTPSRIPPLLWAFPKASIVLPASLLTSLPPEKQRMLVAHELAHYRRGDHLVRWFEAVVAALYWWHPVVWWASRERRRSEEACCDAWVLWAYPDGEREYAHLLLDTMDFLSGAGTARPALASGFGPAHGLKRRLKMILNNETAHRLSRPAGLGLAVVGLIVLTVTVAWGQVEQSKPGVPAKPATPDPAEAHPSPTSAATAEAEPPAQAEPSRSRLAPEGTEPDPLAADVSFPAVADSPAGQPFTGRFSQQFPTSAPAQNRSDQSDPKQRKVIETLISALKDRNQNVRVAAVSALGSAGRGSDDVRSALADFVQQAEDAAEIRSAAYALGLFEPSRSSIEALVRALQHSDEKVQEAARAALRGFSSRSLSRESIDALVDALSHKADSVQEPIRSTLQKIASAEVIKSLAEAIGSEDTNLRKNAYEALAGASPRSSAALDALVEILTEDDQLARAAAVQAIGNSSVMAYSDKVVDSLIAAANDDNAAIRRDAVRALGRVGQNFPAEVARPVPTASPARIPSHRPDGR